MREKGKFASATFSTVIVLMLFVMGGMTPSKTNAAFEAANIYCNTACKPFWQKKPPQPCTLSCGDTTNSGVTTGKCNPMPPGKCIGTGFNTPGGDMKGVGGLDQFLQQVFGKLLDQLMKGGQGGGSGTGQQGGSTGYNPSSLYPTCVRNTATNTVSPIPCTETNGTINYGSSGTVGTSGGTIGGSTSDILLNALSGQGGTGTDGTNSNTNTNTTSSGQSGSSDQEASTTSVTTTGVNVLVQNQQQGASQSSNQQGVLQGDIVVGGSGGMLYVRSRDPQNNTEVAGFYGGTATGQQQSSGVIGRMCGARPWTEGFIGRLVSPTFFDGLCRRFGYQVGAILVTGSGGSGTVPRKPKITITQSPVSTSSETRTVPLQPFVDIWANPSSVRLGARTYIFWNSRDVVSCTETGPSFSHNTLSGGASTVPLSDAGTFVIECTTATGETVRDSVRVNLAL